MGAGSLAPWELTSYLRNCRRSRLPAPCELDTSSYCRRVSPLLGSRLPGSLGAYVISSHCQVRQVPRSIASPIIELAEMEGGWSAIFGLAGLVLCVVIHGLVTLVVITLISKHTATFQVLFIVCLFCVWNITTIMEINCGVHLLKS